MLQHNTYNFHKILFTTDLLQLQSAAISLTFSCRRSGASDLNIIKEGNIRCEWQVVVTDFHNTFKLKSCTKYLKINHKTSYLRRHLIMVRDKIMSLLWRHLLVMHGGYFKLVISKSYESNTYHPITKEILEWRYYGLV